MGKAYMGLHSFSRTELLLGKENMDKLYNSKVMVCGIGGVGAYAVEAMARSGIGTFVLVDDDAVCLTNINRQLHALRSTVGKNKVDVMKERILDINPKAQVITHRTFIDKNNIEDIITSDIDYIVDAIDTVSSKIELVLKAQENGIKIISCMGAGNKLDPTMFKVADIFKTKVCPLSKVIRYELRKRGVKKLKVVYSEEMPLTPKESEVATCKENCICTNKERTCVHRRSIPASISFVPSVAGLIIGGEVIKDIIAEQG